MSEPAVTNLPMDSPDPRSGRTLFIGALGTILVVVVVILLEALYYRTTEAELDRKAVGQDSPRLLSLRAEQAELLEGYRWVNADEEVVAIPIEQAMRLVVDDAAAGREP